MEQLSKEVERVNSDNECIQLMSAEEEERKYINTIKKLRYDAGIEQGIDQGIEQGSFNEKKKIALNLIGMKMSIQDIAKATGLTKEEIELLKNK